MSVTVSCPDGALLSRFSLGQMSEDEIDSLGGHIAQCQKCIRTLDTLNQRDTLLEALAADPKASQGDPTEAVRVVIERLKTRMLAAAESKQAMAPTTTGDAAGGGQEKEPSLEFLSAPEQPDEIGRLGTYRVLKILGQGGMGLVFQAEDMHLRRRVALKVMRPRLAQKPESCERFLREARAAAAIEHDHIVTIHQVSQANGVPFLAMPWLKGMSLEERLQQSPVLPIAEVLRLARQMASGLAAAHSRGLIHRDIKPGNIWLETQPDESGATLSGARVKILDFGLAKALEEATDVTGTAEHITQAGAILGTPTYMSPEQARGEPVDARCDLFSLGVVLYRMCTGQLPFQGTTTGAVLMNLASVQPEVPCKLNPNVPTGLSELIQQLLAKKQADRPASAREVGQRLLALEQELKDAPVSGPTVPVELQSIPSSLVNASTIEERMPIGAPPRSKRRLLVAATVLLLLIGGGTFALYQLEFNTPHGTIFVEIDDPKLEARFKDGELKLYGPDDNFLYSIMPSQRNKSVPAGKYKIKITGADGLTLDTEEFTLVKNGKRTVRVLLRPLPEAKGSDALAQRYKNSLGMEFALVPKGKVWLGGGGGKPGDKEVEFKDDFYLGVYEVTQEEWTLVTGSNPSQFKAVEGVAKEDQKRFPVEHVSWDDTQLFIQRLNATAKEAGWVYRLPTEAEWEYACRGGPMSHKLDSAFDFYFDKPAQELLPDQANWEHGKGLKRTCKVGSYKPNRLGLYDMHGNVWEWCEDILNKGAHRMMRGGSWGDSLVFRCAARIRDPRDPSHRGNFLGLRVARVRVGTSDPDRRAAEWVLSIGGGISIKENDQERQLGAAADLPKGPFELTVVNLISNSKVSDAGLANFKDCKNLTSLDLAGTKVSDAGLVHFKDCKSLTELILRSTPVGDAGLAHFQDCKNLTSLDLAGTKVSDAGLVHFKDCKNLSELHLNDSPVSDAGLAHFKDCKNFTYLHLNSTQVGDAGLAHFKDCKNVTKLVLHHTKVSDAGLANFKDYKNLTYADLHATQVGDAGLVHLKDCKSLTILILAGTQVSDAGLERLSALAKLGAVNVTKTKVTEAAVKRLSATLPLCKIESDHGTIGPSRFTNTLGMEFALVPKGKSWLGGGGGKAGDKAVEFKDDFYLGVYEVTQEEWEKVMGANPSYHSRKGAGRELIKDIADADLKRFPVEGISWNDCQVFLEALNQRDKSHGWVYRLPTEDEWEYACRGGPAAIRADHAFDFYLDKPTNQLLPDQGNVKHESRPYRTCKVGSFAPNRLGLHDMHGNVTEWCHDELTDAKGLPKRGWRGGAYWFPAQEAKAGRRQFGAPTMVGRNGGLRVARVRVGSPQPSTTVIAEQRKALEWVLEDRGPGSANRSYLGLISQGKKLNLATGDKLPEGSFEECSLSLSRVTDAAVAIENLTNLPKVTAVSFHHCPGIGDKELAVLSRSPNFADLTGLALNHCAITAEGLLQIKQFTHLTTLTLGGSPVSAKELAQYSGLKIRSLTMFDCKNAGDEATAVMVNSPHLESLGLPESVTDASLVLVAKCKSLKKLVLPGENAITEAAIQKLTAARPDLRIERAGRVIEPKASADPDRRAAEWVLSIGGGIKIKENGQEQPIGAAGDLPKGMFDLTGVDLNFNQKVSDVGLANLSGCNHLKQLRLHQTSVTDTGLAHVKNCKKLKDLNLGSTQVSDTGLAHFKECTNLLILELNGSGQVTDNGLAHFKGCKNVTLLNLGSTQVSDAGLAHFKDCKNLMQLDLLYSTRVSDEGLAHFKDCKNLILLNLAGTQVSNAGLAYFKDCKNLTQLDLNGTKVSNAGLAHFKDCKNLTGLGLSQTPVTDAGLAYFKDSKNFTVLDLTATQISDDGLVNFKDCKNLSNLALSRTKVTETGLSHLKVSANLTRLLLDKTAVSDQCTELLGTFKSLGELNVKGTTMTEAGVKKLTAALPRCKIESDHGTFGLTVAADPDRRAAEWVLSIGGAIQVNELPRHIIALAELPIGPFELTGVMLPSNKKVTDAEFANFGGCKNLTLLNLGYTVVSDAGLANFKDCTKLTTLHLTGEGMTDAGLGHFKNCKDLNDLQLYGLKISSAGLAHFADCKKLTKLALINTNLAGVGLEPFKNCKDLMVLNLSVTGLDSAELAHFRDCKKLDYLNLERTITNDVGLIRLKDLTSLTQLHLNSTRVTDAGLAHLKGLSMLQTLNLKQTKVTAAEVKKLAVALPKCKIESDHGTFGPAVRAPTQK